jgi:hypothetical protein
MDGQVGLKMYKRMNEWANRKREREGMRCKDRRAGRMERRKDI